MPIARAEQDDSFNLTVPIDLELHCSNTGKVYDELHSLDA